MGTLHNRAEKGQIAKTVLMPGDPLRAEFIAGNYLDNSELVNDIRGMLAFSGSYNGKKITVMGSGMGIPSMGIYSHELYNYYGVENIIRIGSAGSISDMTLGDVLIVQSACTNSNFVSAYELPGTFAPTADFGLLKCAYDEAVKNGINVTVGSILTSDTFYTEFKERDTVWNKMGVLAVDMEAAGLYTVAARAGKKALALTTVSDNIVTGEQLSSEERRIGFDNMIRLALKTALRMEG